MAIEINWSPEADETFSTIFNYLQENWGDKEAEKFLIETNKVLARLELFPESIPAWHQKQKIS